MGQHRGEVVGSRLPDTVFPDIVGPARTALEAALEHRVFHGGDLVVAAGDPSDSLYVVMRGRLRVLLGDEPDAPHVDVGRGETIGEIGLITSGVRTASVVARRDSVLARLSQADFDELVARHPHAMLTSFAGPIIERLRRQAFGGGAAAPTGPVAVAVVPTDDEPVARRLADALVAAVGGSTSATLVDRRSCAAALGAEEAADATEGRTDEDLVAWLDGLELTNDVVVYLSDATSTPWTRRCVRQSDVVLLVAAAAGSPEVGPDEAALLAVPSAVRARHELVLVHEDDVALPEGTAAWLAPRTVDTHHHVRLGRVRDMGRLARLVTGHGHGVVLSGGGARAMAHLGVVRALLEQDTPVDAVGATSGGAIVAALLAMGVDADEALTRVDRASNKVDYTLPFHAMTSGRNWTDSMRQLFTDVQIEDLWLPFFCVSTNLSRPGLEVHRSGSLLHAVRSTTAIPGLLPPVFHDGEVLIDGGLMNNLPVDIMRQNPNIVHVLAVDVGVSQPLRGVAPFAYELFGWRTLWNRVTRRSSETPSLAEILQLSMSMANTVSAERTRGLADIRLEPPVADFALLDFDRAAEMADLAHAYTADALAALAEDAAAE